MSQIYKIFYFLCILFFAIRIVASERAILRLDTYIKHSPCRAPNKSRHEVIELRFRTTQKINFKNKYEIQVSDLNSSFKQVLILDDYLYKYGPLFESKDHFEYNIPECDSSGCDVQIFVYKKSFEFQPKIQLNLDMYDLTKLKYSNHHSKKHFLSIKFPEIINKLSILRSYSDIELNPKYSVNTKKLSLKLTELDLKFLKKNKVKSIELIAAVRHSLKQKSYSEKSFYFNPLVDTHVEFQHKVENPTYISTMAMYTISDYQFETKTVIFEDENEYYKCN